MAAGFVFPPPLEEEKKKGSSKSILNFDPDF